MAKAATGELRRLANGWEARIRIDGKRRRGFALVTIAADNEDGARARCTAMAEIAVRLRRAGHAADADELLAMAARARAGKSWEAILVAVDQLCSGMTRKIPGWTPPPPARRRGRDADEHSYIRYLERRNEELTAKLEGGDIL